MSNIFTDITDFLVDNFRGFVDYVNPSDREEVNYEITEEDLERAENLGFLPDAAPIVQDEMDTYGNDQSPTLKRWLEMTDDEVVTVGGRNKPDGVDSFRIEYPNQNDKDGPTVPVIHIDDARRADFSDADTSSEMTGTSGRDRLTGTDYADLIKGRGGNDRLDGGHGDDRIIGGGGKDTIKGGSGDDTIVADGGNDRLLGGNGDDVFLIKKGGATIKGGEGADTFVVDGSATGGVVRILDFDLREDKIVLKGTNGKHQVDVHVESKLRDGHSNFDNSYTITANGVKVKAEYEHETYLKLKEFEVDQSYHGKKEIDDLMWIDVV